MSSPKISIVIPSFNKAEFIEDTFQSIFNQQYKNLEVLVQDGGSTDRTIEILKKYAKKYSGVFRWESRKDKGQLDAINTGLYKARGDILSFINPDDLYEINTFQYVADAYKKYPNSLWFAGLGGIVDTKGREVAKFWSLIKNFLIKVNSYFLLLITANYLVQPSVFINKKGYKKYGPFTGMGKYVFEYELWLRLGRVSMPVIISKKLSRFRTGGASMKFLFREVTFKKDLAVARKYSGSSFVVFLHWLINSVRLFVNKFV